MKNTALAQWRAGQRSVGVWIGLADPRATELLSSAGYDWLCVDLQHGFISPSDLGTIFAAAAGSTTTLLARVGANQFDQIGKVLDSGAHGVIVPMVSTVAEAERAAAACRYPPEGQRSSGPVRGEPDTYGYFVTANGEVACIVMIETAEGLANVEAIAAVRGVDALFVGPGDLCLGLGLPANGFARPEYKAALQTILQAGRGQGKPVGVFGYTAELAAEALDAGFTFASAGNDGGFLMESARIALEIARREGPAS